MIFSQEERTIIIENADITEFESILGKQFSRLIGNVQFKHQDIYMTCDSAHYFPDENIMDAFSNVHIWRGDTLNLYGDFLKYRGNEKIAEVRRNVTLIDPQNHLTTNYIDFDMNNDIGYYLGGGKIINGNNILKSLQGHYFGKEKLLFFKDSVVVTNPDYIMYSDTLKYNTVTEVSYFFGPTDIVSDTNLIYCENGWYDTKNNISQFSRNAFLKTKDRIIKGDSLYYERGTGLGKAFNHVELSDTLNNVILYGNRAVYLEKEKFALVTDSALMVQIEKGDSLFVHADTLKSQPDTLPDLRILKAYHHVKIYRKDLQGKCDSLVYSEIDSVFQFHGEPVLWTEENQLTAEYISIQTKNKALKMIDMKNSAFIISQEDSGRFNQIKGRNMQGFFRDNDLYLMDVKGNGETVYYARDKGKIHGVNAAKSSDIRITLKDRKIQKITFLNKPDCIYYPVSKFPASQSKLENFKWFGEYRPVNRYDVFRWDQPGEVYIP